MPHAKFSMEKEEMFIELVRQNQVLYDPRAVGHADYELCSNIWQSTARKMGVEGMNGEQAYSLVYVYTPNNNVTV